MVNNGIQKRELVDLEGVVETNLEQTYEKKYIVTKLKDSDRSNEETDIETQTVTKMTVSNNKNDSDISNNKKYVFPNVSYANILKQPSGMTTSSKLPAYVPPQLTTPVSQVSESDLYLTQGDQSLLETLETLCGSASTSSKFIDDRIKGNFVSDYVFNLSQKTLSPLEIKVLEKGLGFSPTPSSINEVDLRRDISDFTRKMRCKWFFRNERQENVSETSEFKSKSTWNPPKGAPAIELFLIQTEKDILSILPGKATNYNLSKEEYLTMRSLQNDRSVVIKPADKGSAVVVWDRNDYLKEAERQLCDEKTYEEIRITEKDQVELVEKSNNLFSNLKRTNVITENENNYFRFNFKKATNLGKLYLLHKIHKGLYTKVPGRPVISSCGTPTEKVSEFLEHHLQPIMKQGESYIRDTGDFLAKLKAAGEVPKGAILVAADVVGLYPSIPHSEGLNILKNSM